MPLNSSWHLDEPAELLHIEQWSNAGAYLGTIAYGQLHPFTRTIPYANHGRFPQVFTLRYTSSLCIPYGR
jgi:hypothetical protein